MPQISPINWVFILLIFTALFYSVLASLPHFSLNAPTPTQINNSHNTLPW